MSQRSVSSPRRLAGTPSVGTLAQRVWGRCLRQARALPTWTPVLWLLCPSGSRFPAFPARGLSLGDTLCVPVCVPGTSLWTEMLPGRWWASSDARFHPGPSFSRSRFCESAASSWVCAVAPLSRLKAEGLRGPSVMVPGTPTYPGNHSLLELSFRVPRPPAHSTEWGRVPGRARCSLCLEEAGWCSLCPQALRPPRPTSLLPRDDEESGPTGPGVAGT